VLAAHELTILAYHLKSNLWLRTLLADLSTIVRNTCEARVGQRRGSTFQMTTMPNPAQDRALQLLQSITV
jgi:hypothetical protein